MVILGGGESGVGSAILAQKEGFDVFLSDKGTLQDYHRETLQAYGVEFEEMDIPKNGYYRPMK